jgi:hypothetical protein
MSEHLSIETELPTAIRDDLLATGDIGIEHVFRFGAGLVVAYVVVATMQKRIACYVDGEAEFDLVVEMDAD